MGIDQLLADHVRLRILSFMLFFCWLLSKAMRMHPEDDRYSDYDECFFTDTSELDCTT